MTFEELVEKELDFIMNNQVFMIANDLVRIIIRAALAGASVENIDVDRLISNSKLDNEFIEVPRCLLISRELVPYLEEEGKEVVYTEHGAIYICRRPNDFGGRADFYNVASRRAKELIGMQ